MKIIDIAEEVCSVNTLSLQVHRALCYLQVGEFCEVSNDSTTDPAAWFAKVVKVTKSGYKVGNELASQAIFGEQVNLAQFWFLFTSEICAKVNFRSSPVSYLT